MSSTTLAPQGTAAAETPTLGMSIGLPGRIAVSWSAAGGFVVGGFLVAAMTLTGNLSGSGLLLTASGLFVIGALLGFAHGAALGFFGRPAAMTQRQAAGRIGLAAVYALPATAIGLVVSGWIAMTAIAQYANRTLPWIMVAISWAIGIALVGYAVAKGWTGLRNAYARWPERRVGTVLVSACFAALLVLFFAERPEIWGMNLRVTGTGSVLLAAFATLWIAGPVVTISLRLIGQMPSSRLAGQMQTRNVAVSLAIGLVAGAVVGLMMLPLYAAPLRVVAPFAAATSLSAGFAAVASQALISEVLLRLFVLTAVAWVLLRAYDVSPLGAGIAATLAATLVQVALYLPAMISIGFPSVAAALAFLGFAVIVPAVVFGTLYWTRGLPAALVAHAAAFALVIMIV
jgi:hypothetical protein